MKEQGTMKKKKKIKVSEEMKNKVVDLYLNTDKTYNEISKDLGLSTGTVGTVLTVKEVKRRGTKNHGNFPRVEKDPKKKGAFGMGFYHMDLKLKGNK